MAFTFVGKIIIVLIVLGIIYFSTVLMPGMFSVDDEDDTGQRKVMLIAFVKTFDNTSSELSRTLAELANSPDLGGIFTYEIIAVDVEKERAAKFAITEEEVPCFIVGNGKFCGLRDKNWLRGEILEVARQSGIIDGEE